MVEEIQQQAEYTSDGKKEKPGESQASSLLQRMLSRRCYHVQQSNFKIQRLKQVHDIEGESERQIHDAEEVETGTRIRIIIKFRTIDCFRSQAQSRKLWVGNCQS